MRLWPICTAIFGINKSNREEKRAMKIGVLGSGDVAKSLAEGFVKHGHQTMVGTRGAAKLAEWQRNESQGAGGQLQRVGGIRRGAGAGCERIGCGRRFARGGSVNLDGKLVMDACNPIADAPPVNGVLRFFTSLDDSLMERLQREFPKAHFVKAFNSVGAPQL